MGGSESKDQIVSSKEKKAELAKNIIRSYFDDLEKVQEMRTKKGEKLELEIQGLPEAEQERKRKEFMEKAMAFHFITRRRVTVNDFNIIRRIGKGSFGEVYLVQHKTTLAFYAMKLLSKERMIEHGQVAHAWVERYALTRAGRHPYVVELYFCFQDKKFLYLIMEYVPGGDMLTMLTREERLGEDFARFYIAELIVAVDALHVEGIIHRDLKPDNVLFGSAGHVRLSDFGLSKVLFDEKEIDPTDLEGSRTSLSDAGERRLSNTFRSSDTGERIAKWKQLSRHQAFSAVGTPNYISPEVLMTGRYDETSDWWSLGIIMFEMLVGYPPFWSSSPASTCRKILGWKEHLKFPKDVDISPEAKDLIQRLICAPKDRLGRKKGRAEFEEHAFFKKKLKFDRLSSVRAPFVPELVAADDTRYFDVPSDGSPEDSETYNDLSSTEMVEKYKRATVRNRFLQRSYGGDFAGYSYMNFTAMGGLESSEAFQSGHDIPDDFILMSLSGDAERTEVENEAESKGETEHAARPPAFAKLQKKSKKPKDTKTVNFAAAKGEMVECKRSPLTMESTERRPEEALSGLGEAKNLDEVTNGNVPVPLQVQISS
ncbi:hypothetical protein NDN08_002230 [Rhodosorus marinus]|uniref:non-specific serine/threonine protein kinase n=1 Tax=Rhodosorus marinus TaxID=101924 RepID=A0AAV8UT43_9RHOD|nr:hypothetical protein NDN08_002230 [Rhodosorus marinus]